MVRTNGTGNPFVLNNNNNITIAKLLSSIVEGRIQTGNPCPICRDEYLVVDYRNVKLIRQFIKEYNGEIMDRETTGVCQKQWLNIR